MSILEVRSGLLLEICRYLHIRGDSLCHARVSAASSQYVHLLWERTRSLLKPATFKAAHKRKAFASGSLSSTSSKEQMQRCDPLAQTAAVRIDLCECVID